MQISLITPAGKQSRNGNRTTAIRWQRILQELGHSVRVDTAYDGSPADMMIGVHAWRSARSIENFRTRYPERPMIVLLSGTDIYKFQHSHPETTLRSMDLADRLVCLHDLVHQDIPRRFANKLTVIHQSAPPLATPRQPSRRRFDICVVGHLREEKDSLRTAEAALLLPPESRLRVLHYGKAHDESWAERAQREVARNPRYQWRGEVPGWMVRRAFAKCHLMVLSSIMEGGANVVSEAVAAGLPVIASDISGSVGLLGSDYGGYYPVGDTQALADRLRQAETDPAYLEQLAVQCRQLAPLFDAEREKRAWQDVLQRLQ
ncbi:MAG: selenosugar synthase SenB [Alphaproteobacteria bacterium]|nr:selenosugar synthase SenB [Alphaproteobacteria bacterium]